MDPEKKIDSECITQSLYMFSCKTVRKDKKLIKHSLSIKFNDLLYIYRERGWDRDKGRDRETETEKERERERNLKIYKIKE